jgi:hypothetical protein
MITELYVFSPSSYVVAEEWNANFRVLYNTTLAHMEAITDAQATIAFPDSDLTDVYNAVRSQLNSFAIPGNTVTVAPECEYYKTLANGQDLVINIPTGLNAEARVLIRIQEDRTLLPFSINYDGTVDIDYGFYDYLYFRSGYYYVMIYETNGLAQAKLIWTGV